MHLQELIGLKAIHSIEHEDVMVKLLALSLRDKAAMWPSSGWAFSPYGNRVGKEIFQMLNPILIFDIYLIPIFGVEMILNSKAVFNDLSTPHKIVGPREK